MADYDQILNWIEFTGQEFDHNNSYFAENKNSGIDAKNSDPVSLFHDNAKLWLIVPLLFSFQV